MLDELATSINTLNLERVRRLKGHLLALTQRVQKVKHEYLALCSHHLFVCVFKFLNSDGRVGD